jgi:hypothetical protein
MGDLPERGARLTHAPDRHRCLPGDARNGGAAIADSYRWGPALRRYARATRRGHDAARALCRRCRSNQRRRRLQGDVRCSRQGIADPRQRRFWVAWAMPRLFPGRRLDQSLPASGAGRGIIALTDVRFVAHCGLKSDFVRGPKTFTKAPILAGAQCVRFGRDSGNAGSLLLMSAGDVIQTLNLSRDMNSATTDDPSLH